MLQQLDFFEESLTEIEKMEMVINDLKKSQDKMRRALFARHGELAKQYCEIHNRLEILERYICKGRI
jgi:hypothetical protein